MSAKWIEVTLWAVFLTGFVIWGQSFRKKQRDLMGNRRYFYMLSGMVIVIALGGLLFRGLHMGLDFTGGTMLEMGSPKLLDTATVRQVLEDPSLHGEQSKVNLSDTQVQVSAELIKGLGSKGEPMQRIMIRLTQGPQGRELSADQAQIVADLFKEKLGLEQLSLQSIGATITGELRNNAIMALVITLGLQLVYIFFRFNQQMRFGVAADIALVHDVVIMVGLYAVAGRQVDSPFVAALLTVTGYSVMDSVIIFDRIRENLKITRGATFSEVVNLSVNQTMTRSINTTLTPVLTLLAIYFFGGATLQNFAFALLVGIISGAYSSICVASPLLIEIDNWALRREKEKLALRRQQAEQRAEERRQMAGQKSERRQKKADRPDRPARRKNAAEGAEASPSGTGTTGGQAVPEPEAAADESDEASEPPAGSLRPEEEDPVEKAMQGVEVGRRRRGGRRR